MNIRPSLKIYFIATMLILVAVLTVFFSALTLNYFEQGLDRGVRQSMREVVNIEEVKDGQPVTIIGFDIASRWKDLPLRVQAVFTDSQLSKEYALQKRLRGGNLIHPPEEAIFAMKAITKTGEIRYISKIFDPQIAISPIDRPIPHIIWIAVFAICAITLFLSALLFIIGKVARPVKSLKNWAKALDEEKLKQPIPDFQYSELNALAEIVKTSLGSVQESLVREQQFLAHASHELRTPIAVIRANTELLNKLHQKEGGTAKQSNVVARIDRAGKSMTNLTNTLLWLSREEPVLVESERLDLQLLIETLTAELGYLLNGKAVQLEVKTAPYTVQLAEIPCRIVLANLIRNAFQHTLEGKVVIYQEKNNIIITNSCEEKAPACSELGFGLGLRLSKKLAVRYGWDYSSEQDSAFYKAQIRF
ncbi:MAG: signal transduction histidine kinase [Psychromonas sp.]|jgi:signal transduction histidine kinase|uniref:sensor histidine kinase n=1 Tax=Psychromonas sp. TaxID=1884585 RepID=UPI0039E50A07